MKIDRQKIAAARLQGIRSWWAYEALTDLIETDAAEALAVIAEMISLAGDDAELLGQIGADALEDLIERHVGNLIDALEAFAASNAGWRTALSAVWFSPQVDAYRNRLEALGCERVDPRGTA